MFVGLLLPRIPEGLLAAAMPNIVFAIRHQSFDPRGTLRRSLLRDGIILKASLDDMSYPVSSSRCHPMSVIFSCLVVSALGGALLAMARSAKTFPRFSSQVCFTNDCLGDCLCEIVFPRDF